MIHRCRTTLVVAALAGTVLLLAPAAAQAGDKNAKSRHPAYVDGSTLIELAEQGGPAGEMIEVTLKKPMLRALGKAYGRHNKLFGEFLKGLNSIHAVVASSPLWIGATGNFETVEREVAKIVSQLEQAGWERMARVREASQTVMVYSHINQDEIDGLTVFVLERADGEFTFTNIAGKIDLVLLPLMGDDLDVPGLRLGVDAIDREKTAGSDSGDEEAEHSSRSDQEEQVPESGSH
ncbi:MAG: DUF4252 domain-containing protein [Planctomycetota bacterium]|jgi:hypothetical protein